MSTETKPLRTGFREDLLRRCLRRTNPEHFVDCAGLAVAGQRPRPRKIFLLISFLFCMLVSCKEYKRNKTYGGVPIASIKQGEVLAGKYCQSCHLLPSPSELDARTWFEGALPAMGPMLGIFSHDFQRYPSSKNDRFLDSNFYPAQPVITAKEWQHIIDYYTATSPDSLPAQNRPRTVNEKLPFFEVRIPDHLPVNTVTLVKFLPAAGRQDLMIADLASQSLFRLNDKFDVIDSLKAAGTIVDLERNGEQWLLCDMGHINPTNGKFGKARFAAGNTLDVVAGLARPVRILPVDVDKDGNKDFLVCEFGYMKGALSWYRNRGNDSFERHVIKDAPGATALYLQDYNRDGLPDIWALFAQGDEGVFLFTNKGNGQFEQEQVLRFPAVYGSTSFQLTDFNKDGFPDIVYTCGDNADYSKVLKPYHGVYVFLNDGSNHFKQRYFFPVNGCYKAIALDFDGDGDLDIATIAFFADYARQPAEGFIYLENKGDWQFEPYSFPESKLGRWLTMDAGDLDGDGRTDLVLGNFSGYPGMMPTGVDWKKGPPFVFLRNAGK